MFIPEGRLIRHKKEFHTVAEQIAAGVALGAKEEDQDIEIDRTLTRPRGLVGPPEELDLDMEIAETQRRLEGIGLEMRNQVGRWFRLKFESALWPQWVLVLLLAENEAGENER